MEKQPVSGNNITSDHLQTWDLKVYVHCEGCKRKVFKVLQSIDGVYKTVIDSKQHKATVTGSVNGDTLVQKLLKSGKHAQILTADNASGNTKKKNDSVTTAEDVDDEKEESKNATTDDRSDIKVAVAGSGVGKHKKKKGDTEGLKTAIDQPADTGVASLELGPPSHQVVHQNYYASASLVDSSYYTPLDYYHRPPPPPPPPTYYRRSAFDDHDDETADQGIRLCTFM